MKTWIGTSLLLLLCACRTVYEEPVRLPRKGSCIAYGVQTIAPAERNRANPPPFVRGPLNGKINRDLCRWLQAERPDIFLHYGSEYDRLKANPDFIRLAVRAKIQEINRRYPVDLRNVIFLNAPRFDLRESHFLLEPGEEESLQTKSFTEFARYRNLRKMLVERSIPVAEIARLYGLPENDSRLHGSVDFVRQKLELNGIQRELMRLVWKIRQEKVEAK